MTDQWVVTWEGTTAFAVVGSKIPPSTRNHKAFDSQKEAVNFAMGLTDAKRQTIQLHMPGGVIAYLASIEEMYAQYQKGG
jgi:hypothetical protein